MKRSMLVAGALAFMPGIAFAQTQQAVNTTDTDVQQQSSAEVIVGGTSFNSNNDPAAATAVAPSQVVSGQWTCGAAGASAAGQVEDFGISIGFGRTDAGCDRLRDVLIVRSGNTPIERTVAAVLACQEDRDIREAWETVGYTCRDIPSVLTPQLTPVVHRPAAQTVQRPVEVRPTPARAELRGTQNDGAVVAVSTGEVAGPSE